MKPEVNLLPPDSRLLFSARYGSHLYGTAVEGSDIDVKVIMAEPFSSLVHRDIKPATNHANIVTEAGDVDIEVFTLAKWLDLALGGQTVALELLFIPSVSVRHTGHRWEDFRKEITPLVLSRNVAGMVGYCRAQASKYGVKGERLRSATSVRDALQVLMPRDAASRLGEHVHLLCTLAETYPYVELSSVTVNNETDSKVINSLKVCGRQFPFTNTVQYSLNIVKGLVARYGARARSAANAEGIDWKALMHALRVGSESVELLSTGHITFPRPEAAMLLRVRKGEVPYETVSAQIEQILVDVELASLDSDLPDVPDVAAAKKLTAETYLALYLGKGIT